MVESLRKYSLLFALLAVTMVVQAQERDETCDPIDSLIVIDTTGNLMVMWNMNDTALAYNYRFRKLGDEEWTINATLDTFIVIDESDECVEYEVSISTVCPFDTSSFTLDTVISFCPNASREILADPSVLRIFPVPFESSLTILSNSNEVHIRNVIVRNLNGQIVFSGSDFTSSNLLTHSWISGVYIVEVQTNKGWHFKKILKW